jgi:hypothetical protein
MSNNANGMLDQRYEALLQADPVVQALQAHLVPGREDDAIKNRLRARAVQLGIPIRIDGKGDWDIQFKNGRVGVDHLNVFERHPYITAAMIAAAVATPFVVPALLGGGAGSAGAAAGSSAAGGGVGAGAAAAGSSALPSLPAATPFLASSLPASTVGTIGTVGSATPFVASSLPASTAATIGRVPMGDTGFTIPKQDVTRATPSWVTSLMRNGAAVAIPAIARATSNTDMSGGQAGSALDALIPELVKRFQAQNARAEQSNGLYDQVLKMAAGRLPTWTRS